MSRYTPEDLEPSERWAHRLLSAVPPQALPVGFRDSVMGRVAGRGALVWEWIVAAALALPSLAFLAFDLLTRGEELSVTLNNVVSAATAETADAFFFVDGSTVLALALMGTASLLAAHANVGGRARRATAAR